MKTSPTNSVITITTISLLTGIIVSILLGVGILGVIAGGMVMFGVLLKGEFTVPFNQVAVLTFLGERKKVIFTEGWHFIIPYLMSKEIVDMRERVWEIPDPVKEPGKDGFTFMAGVKAAPGVNQVEMRARAVLKFRIDDPFEYLANDSAAVDKALRNKTVDEIRERGAHMSAEDFITDKMKIATDVKTAVDSQYPFVTVTGVDIPKADYADAELKKTEQAQKMEDARTKAQHADMLGEHGTISRIMEVATKLHTSGLPEEEATLQAIDLVQTQEGRKNITKIEFATTGGNRNHLAEAAAMLRESILRGGK